MATIKLRTNEGVNLRITPKDDKGKVRPVESGKTDWSSSNEAVATVTEDPNDESKALVKAVGAGTCQINGKADADLGDGEETITGFVDIEVTERKATNLELAQEGDVIDFEETPEA